MSNIIKDPADALAFILGGKSEFTLRSKKSGDHIAYRVQQSNDGNVYFVRAAKHVDDDAGYNYLGLLRSGETAHGHIIKSRKAVSHPKAETALQWTLQRLHGGEMPEQLEVYHNGCCSACGRKLTDPASIERGLGPTCYKRLMSQ